MQALGSYRGGGRMLFLGLGTGLGSALVWDNNLLPLELGDLPYPDGKDRGYNRQGRIGRTRPQGVAARGDRHRDEVEACLHRRLRRARRWQRKTNERAARWASS